MDHNQKALKAGIWYTISNFFVKGIGVLTTPIFTRLLTKAEFGLFHNYNSCLLIATVIVTLNLESSLVSARYDYQESLDEYVFSILTLSSLSAVIWFAVVNLFRAFFSELFGLDIVYLNAILLYLFFYPAVVLYQDRERFRYEYKKTVALGMFVSLGATILSITLTMCSENRLTGVILGSILPTVVFGGVVFVVLAVRGKRVNFSNWRYAFPICIPYIPHLLSMTMLNAMDRTMITKWCGAEDNAMYSLAYTCGSAVSLLGMSLNSAYSPWLGEKLDLNTEESRREINRFSKIYIAGFLAIAVGIMAVSPELLYLLGGRQYMDAKYVLAPISMGCVCQFLYTLFVNVEQYKKRTFGMAVASVAAAIINFILNSVFIPRMGYLAAAYTTLVGYMCLLFMHMFLVRRLNLHHIYSCRFVFGAVLCGLALMVTMAVLYHLDTLRYVVVGIYLGVLLAALYKHRSKVIGLLQSLRK